MEEMCTLPSRYGGKGHEASMLPEGSTLPASPSFTNPETLNPVLPGFRGDFMT